MFLIIQALDLVHPNVLKIKLQHWILGTGSLYVIRIKRRKYATWA